MPVPTEVAVYLLLGSNLRPRIYFPRAWGRLQVLFPIVGVSQVWETPPVGTDGPWFYNAAVGILTARPPENLRAEVLRPLEHSLGRVRTADKYAPRTIDLDIVLWGDKVLDPDLWRWAYIAVPLSELLPDLRHPATGETLKQVAARLRSSTPMRLVALPGWPRPFRDPFQGRTAESEGR